MPTAERIARCAAALAVAGSAVATGVAAHADTPAPCVPYLLPALPGSDGNGAVITISDTGLYGGSSDGADGASHAVYWTHTGSDLSSGWEIHQVPSGLVDDFIGDINADGVMVGSGADPVTGANRSYVFDSRTGVVTPMPGLGGGFDEARRLNDAGVASGVSADTHGVAYAVTWSPPYTAPNKLPTVGAAQSGGYGAGTKFFSEALGINDAGETVGATTIGAPVPDHGFWSSTHQWHQALDPLVRPMTWAPNGAPGKLPTGYAQGFAWDVNDAGIIVGDSDVDASGIPRPAYWVDGRYHDMGAPADIQGGNAYGLRGNWAAGGMVLADGTNTAFVWTGVGNLQALEPAAGFTDSWSHGPNQALHQVGGENINDTQDVPVVWQCPAGFSTG